MLLKITIFGNLGKTDIFLPYSVNCISLHICLGKCFSLGNFDLTEVGRIKEFTSIEKEPLSDDLCKTYLKGNTRNHFRNFVCTNFREEKR